MIFFILHRLSLLLMTFVFISMVSFSLLYYAPFPSFNDHSFIHGYFSYLTQILHGNFGVSMSNGKPILPQLKEVVPATIELCFVAFVLALFIGIPLGIIAGVMEGKWPNVLISTLALFGFSVPVFWLALLLMLFFSLHLGYFPSSGRYDLLYQLHPFSGSALIDAWLSPSIHRHEMIVNVLHHFILPIVSLSITPMCEVIRLMRLQTCTIYKMNYVKAAASRGVSSFTIIGRHLLHNALPPIIAKLGLKFSNMLTLTMLIEVIFNWPGIGNWLVTAIHHQDHPSIAAAVLIIGLLIMSVNILADIFGILSNPLRNKARYAI